MVKNIVAQRFAEVVCIWHFHLIQASIHLINAIEMQHNNARWRKMWIYFDAKARHTFDEDISDDRRFLLICICRQNTSQLEHLRSPTLFSDANFIYITPNGSLCEWQKHHTDAKNWALWKRKIGNISIISSKIKQHQRIHATIYQTKKKHTLIACVGAFWGHCKIFAISKQTVIIWICFTKQIQQCRFDSTDRLRCTTQICVAVWDVYYEKLWF